MTSNATNAILLAAAAATAGFEEAEASTAHETEPVEVRPVVVSWLMLGCKARSLIHCDDLESARHCFIDCEPQTSVPSLAFRSLELMFHRNAGLVKIRDIFFMK